jgi:hypothetical protein
MRDVMIADALLRPLQEHVRAHGERNAEAGGFLLGTREKAFATVLALAEGKAWIGVVAFSE